MSGFALRQHPKHPCTAGATKVIKEAPKEAAFKGSEGSGGGAVGHDVLKSRFEKTSPLPGFLSRKKCSFFHHSENFDFLKAATPFPPAALLARTCGGRRPNAVERPASAIFRAGNALAAGRRPPPPAALFPRGEGFCAAARTGEGPRFPLRGSALMRRLGTFGRTSRFLCAGIVHSHRPLSGAPPFPRV